MQLSQHAGTGMGECLAFLQQILLAELLIFDWVVICTSPYIYLYYAPNFEKVESILLSACPFVCPFVQKNLKLGF